MKGYRLSNEDTRMFLDLVRDTGCVRDAARLLGLSTHAVYRRLERLRARGIKTPRLAGGPRSPMHEART